MKEQTRKLVIVCQTSGTLIADIANEALGHYDEVTLLTSDCSTLERPLDKKVRIDKIIQYNKSSAFKRLFTWTWATLQCFHKLLWHYRGCEIYYCTNPPTSYFCSLLLKNDYRIAVWDLYPNALKSAGMTEKSFIWRLWSRVNRKVFSRAKSVVTLGDSMKGEVIQYCSDKQVSVVMPWIGSEKLHPVDKKDNPFVQEHRIGDKFVVLYSGNMGYTHCVEVLVEVAQLMKEDKDVLFLIIGHGKKKVVIEQMVSNFALENVMILNYQPIEIFPFSLSSADLGVVTLDEMVGDVSVPSKTFNLFAVGTPVLAIANEKTEMYRLLTKYENGRCIPKHEVEEIVDFIRELKNNPDLRHRYSENSLRAAKDFTYHNAKLYFE